MAMVDGNSIVSDHAPVLVSWVAVNNDPYERERVTGQYRLVQDRPVPKPRDGPDVGRMLVASQHDLAPRWNHPPQ